LIDDAEPETNGTEALALAVGRNVEETVLLLMEPLEEASLRLVEELATTFPGSGAVALAGSGLRQLRRGERWLPGLAGRLAARSTWVAFRLLEEGARTAGRVVVESARFLQEEPKG
jgi:hypothetical protein